jgi:hypothetical protein
VYHPETATLTLALPENPIYYPETGTLTLSGVLSAYDPETGTLTISQQDTAAGVIQKNQLADHALFFLHFRVFF